MTMKYLLSMILVFLLHANIYAQNTKIEIELFVRGKPVALKNEIEMSVFSKNDTIKLSTVGSSFLLPDSLNRKKRAVLIHARGYEFYFGETLIAFNYLLPKWIINLDYKPFLDENKWLIKRENKNTKCLYNLNNGTGNILTIYKKNRIKPLF